MLPSSIDLFVLEIQQNFPKSTHAHDAGRTLIRLSQLHLPTGCTPPVTDGLVILDPAQPKPRLLVKEKPRTPRGTDPRNVNPETVAGESWFGFSYNITWDESRNGAQQFVEGALRRFAKDE